MPVHTMRLCTAAPLARAVEKQSQDGDVTGFLLAYPMCYVHVIEVGSPRPLQGAWSREGGGARVRDPDLGRAEGRSMGRMRFCHMV